MVFTENAEIIRRRFPGVWQVLKELGEKPATGGLFSVTTAKNGQPTLSLKKEDKTYYLHSAYNPEEEGENSAASVKN